MEGFPGNHETPLWDFRLLDLAADRTHSFRRTWHGRPAGRRSTLGKGDSTWSAHIQTNRTSPARQLTAPRLAVWTGRGATLLATAHRKHMNFPSRWDLYPVAVLLTVR